MGGIGEDVDVRAEAAAPLRAPIEMTGDIATAVLGIVGAVDRPEDFVGVLDRLRTTSNPQVQDRYYAGLASFRAPSVARRGLRALPNRVPHPGRRPTSCASCWPTGPAARLSSTRSASTGTSVLERFPENSHSRMLSGITMMYTSSALAERVTAFLASHPLATGQRSVEQDLERLTVGVALGERLRSGLGAVLGDVATR